MRKYVNRLVIGTMHKGLAKIFGEKGANFACGGLIILAILISAILRFFR